MIKTQARLKGKHCCLELPKRKLSKSVFCVRAEHTTQNAKKEFVKTWRQNPRCPRCYEQTISKLRYHRANQTALLTLVLMTSAGIFLTSLSTFILPSVSQFVFLLRSSLLFQFDRSSSALTSCFFLSDYFGIHRRTHFARLRNFFAQYRAIGIAYDDDSTRWVKTKHVK